MTPQNSRDNGKVAKASGEEKSGYWRMLNVKVLTIGT